MNTQQHLTQPFPTANQRAPAGRSSGASDQGRCRRTYRVREDWPERDAERAHFVHLRDTLRSIHGGPAATSTILRCWILDCPGAAWSVPDIAEVLGRHERSVWRGLEHLRRFPEYELVESEAHAHWGFRGNLPHRRWLVLRDPQDQQAPLAPRSYPLRTNPPISGLPPEILSERQIRETTPPRSSGSTRTRTRERARGARAFGQKARRRERPQRATHRPLRLERFSAPVAIEAGVWAALRRAYEGAWVSVLHKELCLAHYHQHPEEAERALRTCFERTPKSPGSLGLLKLFRGLYKLALRGEALCDRAEWVEADRAVVLDQLMAGAPLAEDPPVAWREFCDELDARRTAVRLAGDSEHAEVLDKALVRAREGLKQALTAAERRREHRDIMRDVAADPRPQTMEARLRACDLRIDAADREEEARTKEGDFLAQLSDEDLGRYVQQARASMEAATRGGSWRVAENLARTYAKYQLEADRRRRTRVAPAPAPDHQEGGDPKA